MKKEINQVSTNSKRIRLENELVDKVLARKADSKSVRFRGSVGFGRVVR